MKSIYTAGRHPDIYGLIMVMTVHRDVRFECHLTAFLVALMTHGSPSSHS